ncbi:MAG: hypothetical protein IK015_01760 [Treponema sp.]|nr:hypothetical protein [Treponema sp.]
MKKSLLAFTFSLLSFCAFSKSFSLQVVQKNAPGDQVFDASFVVEQTILDHFYDRGMIVSNNAVLVSKNDAAQDKTDLRRSMIEAKIGCMDLFVKLCLNYSALDSANPTVVLLSNIKSADLEIVSLEENKTICKGKFTPPALTDLNNNRSGVEDFAEDIANKIQAELAERGGAI